MRPKRATGPLAKADFKAWLTICGLLCMMTLIGQDLYARRHGEAPYRVAQAIAGGYDDDDQVLKNINPKPLRALPTDPKAREEQLRADEVEAGAIWARAHHAKEVADCPANSRVFYAGCVAALRGEWPVDPD